MLLRAVSLPRIDAAPAAGGGAAKPAKPPGGGNIGGDGGSDGDSGGAGSADGGPGPVTERTQSLRELRPLDTISYMNLADMAYVPSPAEQKALREAERAKAMAIRARPPKIPVRMKERPLLVGREHLNRPFSPRTWNGLLEEDTPICSWTTFPASSATAFLPDRRQEMPLGAGFPPAVASPVAVHAMARSFLRERHI